MDLGLTGKRAIVTGGTRGIGRAIAQLLIEEGATVSICARSADSVATAIAELGPNASGDAVDVSDRNAYVDWINRTVEQHGGLDIFIGNVALMGGGDAEELWRTSFEVDLMHCVRGCTAALPALADSDAGAIVLISSVSSVMTQLSDEERAYGSLKAALTSFGGQLAQAVADQGIRVNTVAPGPVFFPGGIWDEIQQSDPATHEHVRQLTALGRLATPEEIARTVVFLASPASSYTTGATFRVDGGIVKTVQP